MYQFFESIKAEDGIVFNLDYHQKRVNLAFQQYYPNVRPLALDLLIEQQPIPNGLVKCRISYNSNDQKIEFVPYKIRTIESLKLIKDDSIEYSHKFMDRTQLDRLFDQREECDDILILKNGLITDASYANIIFSKHGQWYTPRDPLLKGTQREFLIERGMVSETRISIDDLHHYSSFMLINSMMPFDIARALEIKRIIK